MYFILVGDNRIAKYVKVQDITPDSKNTFVDFLYRKEYDLQEKEYMVVDFTPYKTKAGKTMAHIVLGPFSIMVLHLFCSQVTAVRFCHGAPVFLSEALSGCVHGLGPCGQGSNPCRETSLWGISIMGLRQLCKLFIGVRFSYSPPNFGDVAKR